MSTRTKIVATIGPASESVATLQQMIRAGMNVARLNFSHGTYEHHAMLIEHIRSAAHTVGVPVAIMQDVQGPKIRIGILPEEGVELTTGQSIVFDTALTEYTDSHIPVDYRALHEHVQPGERLLIADGKLEVRIDSVEGTLIFTTVVVGGIITSHKGINAPDSALAVAALTEKDKADIRFGVEQGIDFLAVSFVQSAEDILDARYAIKSVEQTLGRPPAYPIHIIAKIERPTAIDNIEEIIDVSDGIMIARGDLGIEIPAAKVPLVQKTLIDRALKKAKPVIVATQMLDSMEKNPRPTRAEVSDVANAVIDHTDAVMLSNETAMGLYPVETVKTMHDIIAETEASAYDDLPLSNLTEGAQPIDEVMTHLSRIVSEDIGAKGILAASLSGETGRLISRNRPELPMYVTTSDERVCRQLVLSWGVHPVILDTCQSIEELIDRAIVALKRDTLLTSGDKLVVVAGEPVGHAGHVNLLEVREVV